MENWLKNLELVFATEKYSLYINRLTKEISIYNGEDIWEIGLNDLGNIGFE